MDVARRVHVKERVGYEYRESLYPKCRGKCLGSDRPVMETPARYVGLPGDVDKQGRPRLRCTCCGGALTQ